MKFNFYRILVSLMMILNISASLAASGQSLKKKINRAPNGKVLGSSIHKTAIFGKKQNKLYKSWPSPLPPILRQYPEMSR